MITSHSQQCAYRVPESELTLAGGGKTRRQQHVVITDKYQLGRFTFTGVTLTHLSDHTQSPTLNNTMSDLHDG